MTSSRRYTVRLDGAQFLRADRIARDTNVSPADVIRRAVDHYLTHEDRRLASEQRALRLTEHIYLAVSVMIAEQHPEFKDRIAAEADKRAEAFHGAR